MLGWHAPVAPANACPTGACGISGSGIRPTDPPLRLLACFARLPHRLGRSSLLVSCPYRQVMEVPCEPAVAVVPDPLVYAIAQGLD